MGKLNNFPNKMFQTYPRKYKEFVDPSSAGAWQYSPRPEAAPVILLLTLSNWGLEKSEWCKNGRETVEPIKP